jgi:hypothetical protein
VLRFFVKHRVVPTGRVLVQCQNAGVLRWMGGCRNGVLITGVRRTVIIHLMFHLEDGQFIKIIWYLNTMA